MDLANITRRGTTVAETNKTKYFRLDGGNTVLQKGDNGWERWDHADGLISTNVKWSESDPRLIQVSLQEAIALMK